MSQYTIPHASLRIVVGWDNPLETFFVQVHQPAGGRPPEETEVLWVGTVPRALLSVESVRHYLRPYATLPRAIAVSLQEDLDRRTPPTPLQMQLRRWDVSGRSA